MFCSSLQYEQSTVLRQYYVLCNQGCWVGGKISDSNSHSDSLTWSEWGLTVNSFVATNNQWKSWYTPRIICFNKSFKRHCRPTISTWIPKLGVWCKKCSNWTSGVGVRQKNPTPTPSVVRNPTPPKTSDSLRLRPAPDLGGRDQGPHQTPPHHSHVFSYMCDICMPLSHF